MSEELVIGGAFGFVLGLLAGPLLRSWLSWREAEAASREADLVRDVLDRMEDDQNAGPRPATRPRTT
ncbi:MAG TPA: hypothetical protein VF129_04145 [Actinomycetota bacterium]